MKKQIMTITMSILMLSIALAGVEIDLEQEHSNIYSGESIIKQIEICHDLRETEIYMTYDITGNEFDLEGLNIIFSRNPITFDGCKVINITITSKSNYKPDNFNITIQAIISQTETQSYTTKNNSITYEDFGLELVIESDSNGTIEVIKTATNPKSGLSIPELGVFLNIKSDNVQNFTIIKVSYADKDVNDLGIEESTLRLHYFNETSQVWEKYDGLKGGVDTANNYIWAKTNHFSLWGVFGNTIVISNSVSSGGGTRYIDRTVTEEKKIYVDRVVIAECKEGEADNVIEVIVKEDEKLSMKIGIIIGSIIVLIFISKYLFGRFRK